MLPYTFPEIHLWCDTCRPLGGQHGSQAVSSTYLRGIGGTQNRELSCRRSQCEIRQTLYRGNDSTGYLKLLHRRCLLKCSVFQITQLPGLCYTSVFLAFIRFPLTLPLILFTVITATMFIFNDLLMNGMYLDTFQEWIQRFSVGWGGRDM